MKKAPASPAIPCSLSAYHEATQVDYRLQACCLDFLYFNRHLLEAGLRDLVAHPEEARMLPALLAAYGDGHLLLLHTSLESGAAHKVDSRTYPDTITVV